MQIIISQHFKTVSKRLLHKYPNLKIDLKVSLENFSEKNSISMGNGLFKIRMKSSDINKGKRNSLRLVILLLYKDNIITPIFLYGKSEYTNIKKPILLFHLKQILYEFSK